MGTELQCTRVRYPLDFISTPDESAEVWFRKSYIMPHRPLQAFANVASTGDYKIFINERNVTGSLKFEGIKNDVLQSRTFDITRYLKAGDNVIAVWYAPQGKPSHGKQLSLEIYGWDQDSVPFHHQTDGSGSVDNPRIAILEKLSVLMRVPTSLIGKLKSINRMVGIVLQEAWTLTEVFLQKNSRCVNLRIN